ncbi:MAG: 30S ribosomal protein S16 [Elusimicrobia bacterium]|nr:30S ribosomal protein S16 [Elusimicrobiota bacterium]
MTVRLRLQRVGKAKHPYYHLVAIDQRSKRDGKPIELLGKYDAVPKERIANLNMERVGYWLKQGAKPSLTAASVIKLASKTTESSQK